MLGLLGLVQYKVGLHDGPGAFDDWLGRAGIGRGAQDFWCVQHFGLYRRKFHDFSVSLTLMLALMVIGLAWFVANRLLRLQLMLLRLLLIREAAVGGTGASRLRLKAP